MAELEDFDWLDEEDDDEEELLRARRVQIAEQSLNKREDEFVVCWKPTIEQYHKAYTRFRDSEESSDIHNYVKHGHEINAAMRGMEGSNIDDYKKTINGLGKAIRKASTIDDLFPQDEKPKGNILHLYRSCTNEYCTGSNQGFLSLSSTSICMSNTILMHVYVPSDAQVVVWDISSESSCNNIYEIILPPSTELLKLPCHGHDYVYIVNTPFARDHPDESKLLHEACTCMK
jgi:hypothetical protein